MAEEIVATPFSSSEIATVPIPPAGVHCTSATPRPTFFGLGL
jgi:hypothetical protein